MRDPARILPTLMRIARVWMKHPDLRLGQLIVNATGPDPFYTEDDELVAKIEQEYDTLQHETNP